MGKWEGGTFKKMKRKSGKKTEDRTAGYACFSPNHVHQTANTWSKVAFLVHVPPSAGGWGLGAGGGGPLPGASP